MSDARLEFISRLASRATAPLVRVGFGPARVLPSGRYIPIRWPTGLWFRQHTQNDDLHVFVYADRIAVRVHIDTFHGDRRCNDDALAVIRTEIQADLLARLPAHREIRWRDARGGNNQVCAIVRGSGVRRNDVEGDADWIVATAGAWLDALRLHPIPDLRSRVRAPLS